MTDYYGNPNPFPWSSNNITMPAPQASPWTPQLKTNKIPVTSLDEAIAKSGERNSEMYYWDQSKPVIYVVRTDMNGVKSWAQLPYTIPNQESNTPATKADILSLTARVDELANKLNTFENAKVNTTKRKKVETAETEVAENVESNG